MKYFVASLALGFAAPGLAQTASPATAVASSLPLASEIAAKLFPNGTYRKMLGPAMSQMMSRMTENMGAMPIGPFLTAAGLKDMDATKLDKATVGEIMAIVDPAYKQRMRGMMDGMFAAMIPMFENLEPDLRDGLAASLQSRFTPVQLGDLSRFFTTPTGSAFASQQMLLFMDPAVMDKMQAAAPKILAEMPALIAQATKATESLPKPKTFKDLTPAERTKLANLLGVAPDKLAK